STTVSILETFLKLLQVLVDDSADCISKHIHRSRLVTMSILTSIRYNVRRNHVFPRGDTTLVLFDCTCDGTHSFAESHLLQTQDINRREPLKTLRHAVK